MLIPTLIGGLGMGGKLLKNLAGVGDPNTFQLRLVGDTLKIIQSQAKSTTPVLDNMWSVFSKGDKAGKQVNSSMTSVGTTIGSKVIPSLKGIVTAGGKALAGMLAFQGAIAVIGLLAKGWDHLKNGVKNAEKALESTLQTQQEEIDANKSKVEILETTGKRYEELANKAKRTAQEEEEMLRLGNELAEVLPQIKIGTDENGNAIISMTEDMEGYIRTINEAIQRQEVLKAGTISEQADNALTQLTKVGATKNSLLDQRKLTQTLYNEEMGKLQENYVKEMAKAWDSEGKERQKHLQKAEEYRNQMLQAETKYANEYSKIQSEIMKQAGDFRQEAISQASISTGFLDLSKENREAMNLFIDSLDFSEINTEEELANMRRMFRELPTLINDGTVSIGDYTTKLREANAEYGKTGNLKEYNKTVDELAKKLSDETGWDISLVKELFTVMENGALKSANSLDTFLEKFGKTRKDIQNGDGLAKALQAQYNALEKHIDAIGGMTGEKEVDVKILYNLMSDQNLPQEIRDFARVLQNQGMDEQMILPIVASLMIDLKDGSIDNLETVRKQLEEALESLGKENAYETSLDLIAKISGLNVDEIKKQLEEKINSGGMKVKKDVEVTDNGSAEEVANKLKSLEDRPNVKKLFESEVIGVDKLDFYLELIKNLPTNKEYTNKFIVDNHEALSKLGSYKEVLEWLQKQPKEVLQKYGLEGTEEVGKQLDEIKKKSDEITNNPAKPKVDTGELQGSVEDFNALVEASAKVKDGEYKLTFKTDTASAIENINNLTEATKELSGLFTKGLPTLVFRTETAQGSKNITGLKVNVSDYHRKYAGKNFSTKFSTETAQGSKNVTGLKANVSDYVRRFGGKNFSTKFSTQTALASQNVTGLRNNVSNYIKNYAGKTYTTTFKVVTSYSTSGTANKNSNNKNNGTQQSLEPVALQNSEVQVASDVAPVSSETVSATPTPRTSPTTDGATPPKARNYSKPIDVINSGTNYFIEIENVISRLNGQLKLLEEKMENSFGAKRIEYLKEQIKLFEQQRNAQSRLLGELETYQSKLKSYLSGKGFGFDSIGNVTNYHTKLIGMENELKRLEEIANKDKATDAQKKKYEDYKKTYDEIKKVMDEYIKTTFTDIPNAKAEWESLNNEIENSADAIKEIQREIDKLVLDAKVETLVDGFRDLSHELSIIDKLLEHSTGAEKISLLSDKMEILKKQQSELSKQLGFYKKERNSLQKDLAGFGFSFDSDGDITNYAKQVEYLANNCKDFELVQEKIKEYLEYQNDTIPELEEQWHDINNTIKDALKEQLDVTSEMEDKITEVYKKQIEDRIKAMNEETEAKIKEIKKQQDAYNQYREEVDYDNEYEEKLEAVTELQNKLDIAMKDTSISGQKRVKELQKMLADAQKDLDKLVQDKIDKDINDMFDKEQDRLEEENEKAVENFESKWTDSKIAEMVAQALRTGVFTDIEGNMSSLQDVIIDFATESGELFGVLGGVIKDELVTNLDIARDTVSNLSSILKDLGLTKGLSISTTVQQRGLSASPSSVSVNFSSPLVVVEGGVNSDNIGDLESIIKQTEQRIVKNIMDSINN